MVRKRELRQFKASMKGTEDEQEVFPFLFKVEAPNLQMTSSQLCC